MTAGSGAPRFFGATSGGATGAPFGFAADAPRDFRGAGAGTGADAARWRAAATFGLRCESGCRGPFELRAMARLLVGVSGSAGMTLAPLARERQHIVGGARVEHVAALEP